MSEQEYLKLYPGRHKINFHNEGYFCQLISVNGKKINKTNLLKCLKIKDSEIVF